MARWVWVELQSREYMQRWDTGLLEWDRAHETRKGRTRRAKLGVPIPY